MLLYGVQKKYPYMFPKNLLTTALRFLSTQFLSKKLFFKILERLDYFPVDTEISFMLWFEVSFIQ